MSEKTEKKKEKGVLETIREVNEKERSYKLHKESERVRTAGKKDEKQREEYAEKLHREKIELIRMKQGIGEDADAAAAEGTEGAEYTVKQKIGAFFYCNKPMIILATFFIVLAAYLIYDLATKDRPDVTLMILHNDSGLDMRTDNIASIIDEYITDVNGNGEIHSTMYYMPISSELDPYTMQASTTKLFALMQDGETMLVMGNKETEEFLYPEDTLEDLEALYPDNEHIKGYGFYVSGTGFAEDIGYEGELPEDLYIGIRKVSKGARYAEKMQKNYEHAIIVLDNLIKRYS